MPAKDHRHCAAVNLEAMTDAVLHRAAVEVISLNGAARRNATLDWQEI